MSRFLWICLGGAAGTGARYLLSGWALSPSVRRPYGTIGVNVLGSFLSDCWCRSSWRRPPSPTLRLA